MVQPFADRCCTNSHTNRNRTVSFEWMVRTAPYLLMEREPPHTQFDLNSNAYNYNVINVVVLTFAISIRN